MKTLLVEKNKIRANLETVKAKAGKAQVIAVLKANAYGLGLREMAQLCREASIRRFAVTEPEDAVRLRDWGFGEEEVEIRRGERAQRKWCQKTSVFLSRETGMPGNFVGVHQGCQVPF